jgi:hypothetical protein
MSNFVNKINKEKKFVNVSHKDNQSFQDKLNVENSSIKEDIKGFQDKIIKDRLKYLPINLIRGTDSTGRQAWYIIYCEEYKLKLITDCKKSLVNIADYCEILASGYGENPTPTKIEEIEKEFGCRVSFLFDNFTD